MRLSGPQLFRTDGDACDANLEIFLSGYLRATTGTGGGGGGGAALEALRLETSAFAPLTWLEAAVFFLFAAVEEPDRRDELLPLAEARWERYRASVAPAAAVGERLLSLRASEPKFEPGPCPGLPPPAGGSPACS